MKPSQRINEISIQIAKERGRNWGIPEQIDLDHSLIRYLDEQYEKNKPCYHKSAYQVDSQIDDVFYNVCNDCGILFLAKPL